MVSSVARVGTAVALVAVVLGAGLLAAGPAGAYQGCPLGAGAVKGRVLVEGSAPAATKVNNTAFDGGNVTEEKAFPQTVHPGGSGEFHYCGKSVFTWPVETTTQYRINGPKVGNSLTGFIVDIHTKIPFKGDNVYECSVRQEFGDKTVDPFFCSAKGTDSGSRYATIADFTIGVKKLTTVNNPHEETRLLADHCASNDATRCVFDAKHLNSNIYGPQESVTDAIDAPCHAGTTYTFTWSQTIQTTENIGSTASLTLSIGKLVPIVQASVSATYGFSWTQVSNVGGTYPVDVPKGQRVHLLRSAKLNEVTGSFVLAGSGDTNYLIPHATFKWMDKSGTGIITPKYEHLPNCANP